MKKTAISIVMLGVLMLPQLSVANMSQNAYQIQYIKPTALTDIFVKMSKKAKTKLFYIPADFKDIIVDEAKVNYNSIPETMNFLKQNYPIEFAIQNNTITVRKSTKSNKKTISTQNHITKNAPIATTQDTLSPKKETNLEEIVIVGYGKTKKQNLTGSVVQMKASEMREVAAGNITESIVGKVAGVQIVQGSATPGSSGTIKMRGTSTINAGSAPLIVVDGFPLTEGSTLSSIDPNSIEAMDFLKDAASTAIYGSRGANGVIMIKTKEGKKGKINVNVNAYLAFQQRADNVKLVNAYDYAQFQYEARNNGYISKNPSVRKVTDTNAQRLANGASKRELIPDFLLPYLRREPGLTDTNWLKQIFRIAPMTNYSVNINGGSENVNYSITNNYFKQDGILIGTDFERISSAINLNINLNPKLKTGVSLNTSYSTDNNFFEESGWNYNVLDMALISYPYFSPYNADGSLAISEQMRKNNETDGALVENPLAIQKHVKSQGKIFRIFGNTYLDYKIINGLNFKTSIGGDFNSYIHNYFHPDIVGRYRVEAGGFPTESRRRYNNRENYLIENLLTLNRKFGKHSIEAIVGQSYQKEKTNTDEIISRGFPDNSIDNISGGTQYNINADAGRWAILSLFSRANYIYNQKYLLSISIRKDGSSKFGANTKYAIFPAFSAGWVISKENIFPKNNVVNFLKFRGSWGKTGNNQISNFGARALLRGMDYNFNQTLAPGFITNTSPNPNLTWESAQSTNLGMDMNLCNNFLSLNIDYYNTLNSGLLLDVPVPSQSGYTNSLQNIGKLQNRGFEVQLATIKPIKLGNINWNTSINSSINRNKVLALAPGQSQILTGMSQFSLTQVGAPLSQMYGYEIIGVYKSQTEIDNTPSMAGTLVGDYIIKDINGDGKIDASDKKVFGTAAPELIGGWNNSFTYKNFELSFGFYGEYGKMIFSRTLGSLLEAGEGFSMISQDYFDNRYHPINNPNGTMATPNLGNFSNNRREARVSNLFMKDASYLRLRTLKIAYSLPESATSYLRLKNAQIYLMGNNLFTWTKYNGFNVDSNNNNPLTQGYDNANYPTVRTYTFGLNLNF
ncbi:TonB-dependent receptor [Riemerella anatipestifer]|uniref:SusC/RagA family TonB-linked outer membrane protein n=1 Tax=Riemerella anatipestifer TaxID=34085 RepID=UPI0021D5C8F1|nr:TonB-dependent receptor [Riemerella anatipestifer]MCU7560569.1 TonB-dependent receptor [Riemerella anatipestifer]